MKGISKTPADYIRKFPHFFLLFTEAICVERGNALMLTKIVNQMFTADAS